ncbi:MULTISPECIES: ATP-binding protein [unclassified Tatumella]|uniref:ATP-binding protein n=1 Tax=unclassified Tatumella TaxID=2649542 RepID=UPI001BAFD9DE|nr:MULTISPECIES: ATP-binding protein [unclassified Tatumella]MBS0856346.1 HAMP domain-containing protein [Tatumella sp. JGM16]MBS0876305.1 HAMP domain-containing protein [Tatumella sp. JGM82]MBS0889478.1 HAMP domain-containing protein [Tatumella sp. JGM94]MBS0894286.1 HAMP domain-containing protein [Tatumella sp. JGM130]MBS0900600.1 HAMP domain-containing protein [Tatumella sp. JGM100]
MNYDYPGRLFWKMLLGFMLVFLVISQFLWLGFSLLGSEPPEQQLLRQTLSLQLDQAAKQVELHGPAGLEQAEAEWPAVLRSVTQLQLASERPESPGGPPPDRLTRQVTAPDNTDYVISMDMHADHPRRRGGTLPVIQRFLHIPMPVVVFAIPMGLLFSLLLAWNLTRPMRQLREGFRHISSGDLSVRLFGKMQRRHDEFSVVARDFDAMVERLDVLVKAREELLHDISHELRTPLARLQLATALARQSPDNVYDSLERIDNEARKLDKMIGELLTFSRAEHAHMVREQYFELTSLLDAVVADARFEAQVPQVDIHVSYDENADFMVQGNAEMVRRCIENVLRNALRFSSAGQSIDIILQAEQEWLTIVIRDQGPGVEPDKLSSIFDPFVRVASAQSGKGYGLGLAIVRKVILAHHGEVRAGNRPGGGLEISLRLPHWHPQ